jgi:addiction module RelE/StbE family toxin
LQTLEAVEIFKENPFSAKLRNHPLKGKYKDHRAFSAANDLRIIYREEGGHIVIIMIDVGSHNQVY